MATATQKVTLSTACDIPFNKLVLSQSNVRRIKAGISIEELAEDIARRGLLQGLNVRPVVDSDGKETGMFEIPAGGRRYRALELLAKKKRLAKTTPVPCIVREGGTDISVEEDSLVENVQRAPLHPLDQFRAFRTLREQGLSEEEIAARFFISVGIVKQRLKLVSVSDKLLDIYAEDGITLEQLMAFTVSSDHSRQEQVWTAIEHSWSKEPYQIRRMMTENTVRASDRRVRFITIEAYEDAGGTIMRDLFQNDDGGWIEDVALLQRLVADKLKAEAETIAEEGWKWIEVAADFPYGHTHGLQPLVGMPVDLTDEERARREALRNEFDRLEAEYAEADELPDEIDTRLGQIETELEAFDERPACFDPVEIARAGAFVSIALDGRLAVDRGYVRPSDVAPKDDNADVGLDSQIGSDSDGSSPHPVATTGADPQSPDAEDGTVRPLPDRLVSELTAHRTLALRDALAKNPHVAMTALLHTLVRDAFQHAGATGCLEVSVRHVFFPVQPEDLKDGLPAKAIAERHQGWLEYLPADDDALWDWIDRLDEANRMALLAHCISFGVNALHEKPSAYGTGTTTHGIRQRISEASRIARCTGLDMVEAGWRPTVDNYLGRITKARIIEAVREARGEADAQMIDHLKKTDMALRAEQMLDGAGWLPEPLRSPEPPMAFAEEGEISATDGGETAMDETSHSADPEETASPTSVAAE